MNTQTVTLNDIRGFVYEALDDMKFLGYTPGLIENIKVSYRYTRAWAKCTFHFKTKTFTITVSDKLYNANRDSVRDTIYHEVIHTLPGCFNHGPNFKRVMQHLNNVFNTHISVTKSESEMYNGNSQKNLTMKDWLYAQAE
jgi:hypothetical protein